MREALLLVIEKERLLLKFNKNNLIPR